MITVSLKVVPNGRKTLLKKEHDQLKLYVTAPPVNGKANAAVIDFFSDALHIPKRSVVIVRGVSSRQKTLSIDVVQLKWQEFLLGAVGSC